MFLKVFSFFAFSLKNVSSESFNRALTVGGRARNVLPPRSVLPLFDKFGDSVVGAGEDTVP